MPDIDIDKLQIEIEASSTDAASEVNRLADAMKNLKQSMGGKINNPIKEIQRSAKKQSATAFQPKDLGSETSSVSKAEGKVNRLVSEKKKISKPEKMSVDTKDVDKAAKKVSRLTKLFESIKRIAFYRAIRSGLKSLADGFSTGVKNLYEYSKIVGTTFKPAIDDIATSALYAKNSLGAMVAPIIESLAPAIRYLTDLFAKATEVITQFFAVLSGKSSYSRAIRKNTEFAKSAEKAAKAIKSFTIGIDELNVINDATSGAGGAAEDFGNMFEEVELTDDMIKRMKEIANWVEIIGAGLAAWAIGKKFGLDLLQIGGLAAALYGSLEYIQDIFNMWKNGISFDNLKRALIDLALVVSGLALAFGKVGAGIGLMVGSGALLVTAIKDIVVNGANLYNSLAAIVGVAGLATGALLSLPDALGKIVAGFVLVVGGIGLFKVGIDDAIRNGVNFNNTLLMVAGTLSTGIGLSLITKSFIPAFIGAIGAAGIAIAYFTGHGEELVGGLQKVFNGFSNFFRDVFNGDMEAAGEDLKLIWEGVKESAGAIWSGIKDLAEKTWDDLKEWWNTNVAKFFTADYWQELGENIKQGFLNGVNKAKDDIKKWASGIVDKTKNALGIHSPSTKFYDVGSYSAQGLNNGFSNIVAVSKICQTEMQNCKNAAADFSRNSENEVKTFAANSNNSLNDLKDNINSYIKETSDFYKEKLNEAQSYTKTATARMTDAYNAMSRSSVSAIGRIIAALDSIPRNITTVHTIVTESFGGGGSIPAFASGGFPEDGLFFANRGELVGNFSNGKTAVANNEQIIAGISNGVASANAEQNALLREQNELLTAILAKTGVSLDGKSLMTSVERAQRQRGANIMAGGVRV